MRAASLNEVLNAPVAVPARPSQISAQPPQTFKDSLVVACKPSSTNAKQVNTGTVLQPAIVIPSPVLSERGAPPLAQSVQQPPLLQTSIVPLPLPQAEPAPPVPQVAGTKSAISRAAVANPRTPASSHLPQLATSLPTIVHVLPSVPELMSVVASPPQNSPDLGDLKPQSTSVAGAVLDTAPAPTSDTATRTSAITPKSETRVSSDALSAAVEAGPDTRHSIIPVSLPATVPYTLPAEAAIKQAITVTSQRASGVSEAVPDIVRKKIATGVPVKVPVAVTEPAPGAFAGTVSDVTLQGVPEHVVDLAKAPVLSVVPPVVPAPLAPPQVVQNVNPSANREADPRTSAAPPPPVDSPAAPPNPATDLISPVALVDPLAAPSLAPIQTPIQTPIKAPSLAAPVNNQTTTGASAAKASNIPAAKEANDLTFRPHVQPIHDQNQSQTGSQGQAFTDDQSQGATPQNAPGVAPAPPPTAVNHPLAGVDHMQNSQVAVPVQNTAIPPSLVGHTGKAPETPALTVSPLPQAVPVVNTARLIQIVGQSEMRVGIRSSDFGNISISTSATREVISAQIVLDHSELARTLNAHLPEMQARLGGNQAMDVRIDLNGQATGQGLPASAGMSPGSGEGSRGEQQPRGNSRSNQPPENINVTAAAAMPLADGRLDTRLDVRA